MSVFLHECAGPSLRLGCNAQPCSRPDEVINVYFYDLTHDIISEGGVSKCSFSRVDRAAFFHKKRRQSPEDLGETN